MRSMVSVQNVTSDGVYKVSVAVPFAFRIISVSIVDANGIAADNTDYIDGDITGTTGYDSRAANQGALTAGTALALTLSPGATVGAVNGVLAVNFAKGGAGKAAKMGVSWLIEAAN